MVFNYAIEFAQVEAIGRAVMDNPGKIIGFVVDNQEKADRYKKRLTDLFPEAKILLELNIPSGVLVKVTKKLKGS